MIIAETCNLVKITTEKAIGGALPNKGSYYNEFQIINNLNEDILALDFLNRPITIEPDGDLRPRDDERCVVIQYRAIRGPRKIASMAQDVSFSEYYRMTIPYNLLFKTPVFVEEVNALLYHPRWHPFENFHPHSKKYLEREHDRYRRELYNSSGYMPINIIANDPSGRIKALYVVINGEICTSKVTNYDTKDDTDEVGICVKKPYSENLNEVDKVIHKTSFTELHKTHSRYWEILGFQISSDLEFLKRKLKNQQQTVEEPIPPKELEELVTESQTKNVKEIERLNLLIKHKEFVNKELVTRNRELQESLDDMTTGGFLDRKSDHAFRTLEIEEQKHGVKIKELENSEKIEKLKVEKEEIKSKKEKMSLFFNAIINLAKTAFVVVTTGFQFMKIKKAFT